MVIHGRVENGISLPDGTEVTIVLREPRPAVDEAVSVANCGGKCVEFPLVRSGQPGSLNLTGERIAEILDEEDAAGLHRS